MNAMKKALVAGAVSMALAGTVHAGSVILDFNGTGQGANALGVDQFNIAMFSWNAGNLLIRDTTPVGAAPATTELYAQALMSGASGSTGTFSYNNNVGTPSGFPGGTGPLISGQFTYQLRLIVEPAAVVGQPNQINYNPAGSVTSFFDVFYNPTQIASDVTGCGYGSHQSATCGAFGGTLILSGSAVLRDTVTLTQSGTDVVGLDQFADAAGDVDNGVTSRALGLGALAINVDITYQNPTFVLSNIISITTDVAPDIQHTETGGSPFTQANPSDEVVGNELQRNAGQLNAAYGTDRINNIGVGSCVGSTNCDIHMQTNPSTSVITTRVPEPMTVGLLGLGLAGVGFSLRRRRSRSA